jgi:hypothetical protein
MKKSLLATVAAVALFAGTGFAVSQGAKDQPAAKGGAEMNRGADSKGGAEMKGGADKADKKADSKAGADVKPGNAQMKSDTKASTTGQGAADQKAQSKDAPPTSKVQAQDKQAPASRTQAQDKAQDGKAQAQDKQAPATRTQAQDKQAPASRTQAQDSKQQPGATTGQGAAGSTQAASAPSLTTEQKTKIRTTVIQSSSAPKIQRSQINFNISVGTVVPRTVKFVAVPATLVEIHPAWRGYRYFIVDDEIIIVEPSSFRIVAVLSV